MILVVVAVTLRHLIVFFMVNDNNALCVYVIFWRYIRLIRFVFALTHFIILDGAQYDESEKNEY